MIGKLTEIIDGVGNNARTIITRVTQFVLGLDGVLHLAEMGSAYYEQAWTTFALTSFHTLIFFTAVYLVGHDHLHHAHKEE
ncbi:hypothetical protein CL614_02530 [archaeon]|nr:hypothetical protein [archaeon]|tara:strand:+ start:183 stop:425 length:243 start_codon:yes stop_codon:yes gene_type:complete